MRCPKCGSNAIWSTLGDYDKETEIDPNRHTCDECGYQWKQVGVARETGLIEEALRKRGKI
jgi:transposase-like protein